VIGGGNYVPKYRALNDVWCSTDGVHWQQVTDHAPWNPRIWFSAVVYRDRMWILGGWSNHPSRNWGDVWHSRDGREWTQLRSNVVWKERHEHSAYVFHDKIWVAGGHAQPLSSEVWSLEIPPAWFEGPGRTRVPALAPAVPRRDARSTDSSGELAPLTHRRQGRSGQGSSPCPTQPRSRAQTTAASRRRHRLPRWRGAGSWNRRRGLRRRPST
jgi:hypothetical protein